MQCPSAPVKVSAASAASVVIRSGQIEKHKSVFRRALHPHWLTVGKSKKTARKLIKAALVAFQRLCVLGANISELRTVWRTIQEFIEPSYDPEIGDAPDGALCFAGLEDICWSPEDVRELLRKRNIIGAMADIDMFMRMAFGEEKRVK